MPVDASRFICSVACAARSRAPRRLAHDWHAAPVPPRVQGSGMPCARLPRRGQARQRRRATGAQGDRRPAHGRGSPGSYPAARAASRVRRDAIVDDGVHGAARVPVRQGHAARGAHHRARGLPAPARAQFAVPSFAPDRRSHARRRARHARHLDAGELCAFFDSADAGRDRARLGDPDHALRLLVHRHNPRSARHLHRLHREHHGVAYQLSPDDERARFSRACSAGKRPRSRARLRCRS